MRTIIFDTGYTLRGDALYHARNDRRAEAARAVLTLDRWSMCFPVAGLAALFSLDNEIEALLTGALPSELEG